MSRPHVVIIGSGFGGLFAAQRLRKADVDITLIARTTHHLFQPMLYQVATGIVSEGEIAPATRVILRKQRNVNDYEGDPVSNAALASCLDEAESLLALTRQWLKTEHPDLAG